MLMLMSQCKPGLRRVSTVILSAVKMKDDFCDTNLQYDSTVRPHFLWSRVPKTTLTLMQIDRAFNQETIIPFEGVKVYPVLFITLTNYLNAQFIPASLSFLPVICSPLVLWRYRVFDWRDIIFLFWALHETRRPFQIFSDIYTRGEM